MNGIKKSIGKVKYAFIIFLVVLLYYALTKSSLVQHYFNNPELLRTLILGMGLLAPLVLIFLQAFQTTLSIFPSQITTIAAGFIFGPFLGLAYSLAGAFIGSAVVFFLSKRYGKDLALKFFNKKDVVHFNLFFKQKKFWALFIARITPIFPNDIVSFAAGLTTMKFWRFCLVSTSGFVIQMVVLVYFGAGLNEGQIKFVLYLFRILVGLLLFVVLFKGKFRKILIKDIHKLEKEGKIIEKEVEKEFKKI
ncbi:MAG: TVP38/TMEM64 family protein [Nanoarchaeota archaeon]|nr:TVP38/TMEM64 family protein [Nanoarchaeota archaeon]MBU1644547.1 TVP38/TMEM64 family protein [Nanoarchaeota archaeon]MBU1976840.1 TVP38/TMEM64 family protein [Nanoarchaeota archaeon]